MISIYTILYLLFIHWVGDFLFQTTKMGTQKSKDNTILLEHYNRVRERRNGHGSCGLGVAATMKRNIETPYKLYAADLLHYDMLVEKLMNLRGYYLSLFPTRTTEQQEFRDECKLWEDDFIKAVKEMQWNIVGYDKLLNYADWVMEGSQGIMLDASHGIFPNVTYANTTSRNAVELAMKFKRGYDIYYVTRCYQTRHGAGWMSNEGEVPLVNNQEEINVHNEWQKGFRIGELDYNLLNYALKVDSVYASQYPHTKNLVMTCLDQRPDFTPEPDKLDVDFDRIFYSYSPKTHSFDQVKARTTSLI